MEFNIENGRLKIGKLELDASSSVDYVNLYNNIYSISKQVSNNDYQLYWIKHVNEEAISYNLICSFHKDYLQSIGISIVTNAIDIDDFVKNYQSRMKIETRRLLVDMIGSESYTGSWGKIEYSFYEREALVEIIISYK